VWFQCLNSFLCGYLCCFASLLCLLSVLYCLIFVPFGCICVVFSDGLKPSPKSIQQTLSRVPFLILTLETMMQSRRSTASQQLQRSVNTQLTPAHSLALVKNLFRTSIVRCQNECYCYCHCHSLSLSLSLTLVTESDYECNVSVVVSAMYIVVNLLSYVL
jgi:hypothetical protein